MKYDVIFKLYNSHDSNLVVSGYLSDEPFPADSLAEVKSMVEQIQSSISSLTRLTVFTRETGRLLGETGRCDHPSEITVGSGFLNSCVMGTQIVELP